MSQLNLSVVSVLSFVKSVLCWFSRRCIHPFCFSCVNTGVCGVFYYVFNFSSVVLVLPPSIILTLVSTFSGITTLSVLCGLSFHYSKFYWVVLDFSPVLSIAWVVCVALVWLVILVLSLLVLKSFKSVVCVIFNRSVWSFCYQRY